MDKELINTREKVKKELANYLGLDVEDIEDDFSLIEDLHMKPTDLTDFAQILSKMNFETEDIDFTEIETFSDLVDWLAQH